ELLVLHGVRMGGDAAPGLHYEAPHGEIRAFARADEHLARDGRPGAYLLDGHVSHLLYGRFRGHGHTSRLLTLRAFVSMNSLRGSTSSPMRIVKILSDSNASSILTCFKTRVSGFMVVSQSC